MKVIATALIAVFTTVMVLVGFSSRTGSGSEAAAARTQFAAGQVQALPVSNQQPAGTAWQAQADAAKGQFATTDAGQYGAAGTGQAPVLVNCGPNAQTLVRQVMVNGEVVSQVDCVADQRAMVHAGTMVRPVSTVPVYETEAVVTTPRVVRVQEETYRRPAPRRVVTRDGRSWKKTAMIIGGSSAAGAGIGGLFGGKKGALIGAAVGGGASTIYEAAKRR